MRIFMAVAPVYEHRMGDPCRTGRMGEATRRAVACRTGAVARVPVTKVATGRWLQPSSMRGTRFGPHREPSAKCRWIRTREFPPLRVELDPSSKGPWKISLDR